MRKSIVLLVTLVIILSLTLIIFATQKETLKLKPLYKNIYISNQTLDIVPFLNTALQEVNSSEALKTFIGIPFSIEKMKLLFSPLHTKVNINRFIDKFPLDRLRDEELFRELIKKSKPKNYLQFEKIVSDYYEQSSDYYIYEVDWKSIVEFEGEGLNLYFISDSLLDYFEVDKEVFNDAILRGDTLNDYLHDINYTTYFPKILVNIEIQNSKSSFIYNLKDKTVSDKKTVFK